LGGTQIAFFNLATRKFRMSSSEPEPVHGFPTYYLNVSTIVVGPTLYLVGGVKVDVVGYFPLLGPKTIKA